MKPEALDAITTPTMRPSALEAATAQNPNEGAGQVNGAASENQHPRSPGTPFGQRTDGTQSAVKAVEEVFNGVKAVVDGALAWAEKKVDALSTEADSTGPYTSPATCAPSDLDPIASGVLPALPTQVEHDKIEREKKTGKEEESSPEAGKTHKAVDGDGK